MNIKEVLFKKRSCKKVFSRFFRIFLPNFLETFGAFGFVAFIPSALLCAYAGYYVNFECHDGSVCGSPWGWVFAFAIIWFLIPFFLLSLIFAFVAAFLKKDYTPSKKWQIPLKIIGLLFYLFVATLPLLMMLITAR